MATTIRSTSFRAGVLGAIATLGLGSLATAQLPAFAGPTPVAKPEPPRPIDAEPTSSSANFGDWALRCQRLGDVTERANVCEVAQQIRAQDQQNPVAELAVGRLKEADPLRLTIVLPVNVTFSNPPTFSADDKMLAPLKLDWQKCLPGGCIADAILKDDLLGHWKTQTSTGRITWTDASGRDLAIGVSSRGLVQALDALSKAPE
jgi:invasion protein IalB